MRRSSRLLVLAAALLAAVLLSRTLSTPADPGLDGPAAAASRAPEVVPASRAGAGEVVPEARTEVPARPEVARTDEIPATTAFEIRLEEFGEPQGGVEVVLSRGDFSRRGKTDPHGVYRADLPEGEYRLEIPSRGLVTAIRASGLANASASLELPGRATLEGRVVDAEDLTAVAEAWVEVYPEGWDGEQPAYHRMAWTQTDEAGRFRIEGLPERPVLVVATRRSHTPWRQIVVPSGGSEIRLVPLGGFRILLRDGTGEPAGYTPVEVGIRGPSGFDQTYEALSDDGGRIHVTDLASGPYRVRIRPEGGDWSDERNVFAAPGESLPIEFRVQRNETER